MHGTLVSLKAFGDFVIACSALRTLKEKHGLRIIAGEHVRSLAKAIGVESNIDFIGDATCVDVPACFDIRKKGLWAAFVSLYKLRQSIGSHTWGGELIFDNLGWRERVVGFGKTLKSLSADQGNIYLAYDHFFQLAGYELSASLAVKSKVANQNAIIIPGARVAGRVIPKEIIGLIFDLLKSKKIPVSVLILDGELFDIPTGIPVLRLPRSFDNLVTAIQQCGLVISADSLPSHLSEFFNVPVFVSTPKPKPYWLPRSSYINNGWATFENTSLLNEWLEKNIL